MPTLAFIALSDGHPTRASLEVLSRCRELASGDVQAVVLSSQNEQDSMAAELGRYGAQVVHTVTHPVFANHVNAPVIDALAQVIGDVQPEMVAFPSTESVKDILGALAARLEAPVLPDVADFELDEGKVSATRPVMAAKFMARVEAEGSPVLVSVRAGSYAAQESPVAAEVREVPFDFDESSIKQTLREVVRATTGAVELSEARVVVAAGRGVRDDAGLRLVEELAAVTGAAIGATRAVVESGMFEASAQIGQTGKVVSPEVYFAVGLSGAVQHTAGMTNSRVIVAINKDADAPIFNIATFGLVGDLHQILPALIEEIKKAKG